jgi:hypothetical protein
MQETLDLVRLVHAADPRTKASICQAISKATQHIADNEHRVWRVGGQNGICGDVAQRRHDGNPALAKPLMDAGIGEGGDRVSGKGSEEEE